MYKYLLILMCYYFDVMGLTCLIFEDTHGNKMLESQPHFPLNQNTQTMLYTIYRNTDEINITIDKRLIWISPNFNDF